MSQGGRDLSLFKTLGTHGPAVITAVLFYMDLSLPPEDLTGIPSLITKPQSPFAKSVNSITIAL